MNIEDQLRDLLRATGKTPQVMGAEAGVDYSQIYRFLNRQTQLRSGTVAKLCDWAGLVLVKLGEAGAATQAQMEKHMGDRAEELAMEIVRRMAEMKREEIHRERERG